MIRDSMKQPDEEIQRAGSGKVLSGGALFPWSWGIAHSWWLCFPAQELSEPCTFGIFMKASLHRHNESQTQSPALLSFPEDGLGIENREESSELLMVA